MTLIQLQEQLLDGTLIQHDTSVLHQCMEDGQEVVFSVKRGSEDNELCLSLKRNGDEIRANGSYFVGVDWVKEQELAVQVSPKMNDGIEIDYVKMLNDALCEPENFDHLKDLVTIKFDKPSVKIQQNKDLLSIFLVTEFLNVLQRIVKKGLKKGYITIEKNLHNKVKGRILVGRNINYNLTKGKVTDNICRYQIYNIDTQENRILKKALLFCSDILKVYQYALDVSVLQKKVRYIKPHFENVGSDVSSKTIKTFKGNPVFREYNLAIEFAQLLMHRFSYDITFAGRKEISTPPFWIDMSKLFELYVFHHLRLVFTAKEEVKYHVNAHYQELDYLLNPKEWANPYVIDAKYKPRYKSKGSISMEDAREVAGYARLSKIYDELGLDEETAPPIKCLIIYPDQEKEEKFTFTRESEPKFDAIGGYIRMYKVGIRLPEIKDI
jgi:5-methylcytosine-specific restriction enzyme subunit McrC